MDQVGEAEVRELAELAGLCLGDAEVREHAVHLRRLLEYVAQLQAIDVAGTSEAVHLDDRPAPLRTDTARPGLAREDVMAGAPATSGGLFEVPRVIRGADERGSG